MYVLGSTCRREGERKGVLAYGVDGWMHMHVYVYYTQCHMYWRGFLSFPSNVMNNMKALSLVVDQIS